MSFFHSYCSRKSQKSIDMFALDKLGVQWLESLTWYFNVAITVAFTALFFWWLFVSFASVHSQLVNAYGEHEVHKITNLDEVIDFIRTKEKEGIRAPDELVKAIGMRNLVLKFYEALLEIGYGSEDPAVEWNKSTRLGFAKTKGNFITGAISLLLAYRLKLTYRGVTYVAPKLRMFLKKDPQGMKFGVVATFEGDEKEEEKVSAPVEMKSSKGTFVVDDKKRKKEQPKKQEPYIRDWPGDILKARQTIFHTQLLNTFAVAGNYYAVFTAEGNLPFMVMSVDQETYYRLVGSQADALVRATTQNGPRNYSPSIRASCSEALLSFEEMAYSGTEESFVSAEGEKLGVVGVEQAEQEVCPVLKEKSTQEVQDGGDSSGEACAQPEPSQIGEKFQEEDNGEERGKDANCDQKLAKEPTVNHQVKSSVVRSSQSVKALAKVFTRRDETIPSGVRRKVKDPEEKRNKFPFTKSFRTLTMGEDDMIPGVRNVRLCERSVAPKLTTTVKKRKKAEDVGCSAPRKPIPDLRG